MTFAQAFVILIVILFINLLINRIATVALTFTGMSREMARFQARSAFCTVGFTTSEAESVVNHPVRRRIIMLLMLSGNVGFVSVIVTAVGSMGAKTDLPPMAQLLLLIGVLAALWAVGMSKWVDDLLFKVISWALRRLTSIEAYDFHNLLHLQEGYCVTTMPVGDTDWLVSRSLGELRLADLGINILGVKRADGRYLGAPVGRAQIRKGDELIMYGARESIQMLGELRTAPDGWDRHRQLIAARKRHHARLPAHETALGISEILVDEIPWLDGVALATVTLGDRGLAVLGLDRKNGARISAPENSVVLRAGDKLFCYGSHDLIRALRQAVDPNSFRELAETCMDEECLRRERDEAGAGS